MADHPWLMADHPWLGPVLSRSLRAVVRRDPLESCETCGGNGVYEDEYDAEYDCPCCEDSYHEPTAADIVGHVLTLSHADRVDLLRGLLRAAPDAAVVAVDAARILRAWSPPPERSTNTIGSVREALGRSSVTFSAWPDCWDDGVRVRLGGHEAADAALVADGWVLAEGGDGYRGTR